jgi:regulatory protein
MPVMGVRVKSALGERTGLSRPDFMEAGVRITAVRKERQGQRVRLYVDDEPLLVVHVETYMRCALRVGDDVDATSLEALRAAEDDRAARESALRLLAQRARTESEMRRRLLRRGYARTLVDGIVGDLVARSLVNDAEFALAFALERTRRRPRGERRLLQELRARGVSAAIALSAVTHAFEEEGATEHSLAARAADDWLKRRGRTRPAREDAHTAQRREQRRLHDYLARRGFAADAIRAALERALPPA